MTELTKTQTAILAHAAARADGAVLPLPETLALTGGARTTALTALLKRDLVEEIAGTPASTWGDPDRPRTLRLTAAGREAAGSAAPKRKKAKTKHGHKGRTSTGAATPARKTKLGTVLDLLCRPEGAGIAELRRATGWQAHSVRAALTGLRKRGHAVTREKTADAGTVYRVFEG